MSVGSGFRLVGTTTKNVQISGGGSAFTYKGANHYTTHTAANKTEVTW